MTDPTFRKWPHIGQQQSSPTFRKWPGIGGTGAPGGPSHPTVPTSTPVSHTTDPWGGLTGSDRDIAVALTNMFKSYGLGTLAPRIMDFIKQGYSADTISILLQDTPEYKQRFAANDARLKAGLPVLSPAEYLATEKAYRDIMSSAGLPKGFYDQPSDFTSWIAGDVSPTEIKQRVDSAAEVINKADPNTLAYAKQFYSTGDLIAYALDQKRAAPLVEKQFQAMQVGGAAAGQGIGVDRATAERLAAEGINGAQAQQGFGVVASQQGTVNKLNSIYGDNVSQNDLIGATFEGNATADQKIKRLASKERAQFGGTSGQTAGSLKTMDAGTL